MIFPQTAVTIWFIGCVSRDFSWNRLFLFAFGSWTSTSDDHKTLQNVRRAAGPHKETLWAGAMWLLEKKETTERGRWRGSVEMLCVVFSISHISGWNIVNSFRAGRENRSYLISESTMVEKNGDFEQKSRGSRPTKDVNKRKMGEDQSGAWGIKIFWAVGVGSEASWEGEGRDRGEVKMHFWVLFCLQVMEKWKNLNL